MKQDVENKHANNRNVQPLDEIEFNWADGKRVASLTRLYNAITQKVDGTIRWYQTKRERKRKLVWCFRVTAILLGAVATALPTIAEMTRNPQGWGVPPGTATLVGIAVGALLMLDKFIGASSSWLRFTMAETALKELRDELTLAYAVENASWVGMSEPTIEQTKHAVATLQSFLARASQIVREETNQWKTEFQGALQQIDQMAKEPPRKIEEAIAIVKIVNPERLVQPWKLSVDGGTEQEVFGDSKSISRTPGSITVRVQAKIKTNADGTQTRDFTTETAEILAAGAAKIINISLPSN